MTKLDNKNYAMQSATNYKKTRSSQHSRNIGWLWPRSTNS